jgi:hypothetical protein
MTVYEQSDGFVPNKQTPPATSKLGASDALWGEVNATAVSGTTVNAGALTKLGFTVPGIYTETVDLVAATAYTVTHGLNNSNPLVQVYGSGTNEQLGFGSGVATVITALSGASANAVHVTVNAAAPGSTVVVIG